MKLTRIRIQLDLVVIVALLAVWLLMFGFNDRASLFGTESNRSVEATPPPYTGGFLSDDFSPECGDNIRMFGGGGFGFNGDLQYHTRHASVIVEGTARLAGPARIGHVDFLSGTARNRAMETAGSINTPYVIEVSRTHKGPEYEAWIVSETGGLVDCISYEVSADQIRMFDGVTGLFFISGAAEFPGDRVLMASRKCTGVVQLYR